MSTNMSSNRPFLSNFLAAFRAQSTYKSTQVQQVGSISPQISSRAIASKANQSGSTSASATASNSTTTTQHTQATQSVQPNHYHAESSPPTSSSNPIPINRGPADRQRRGSDSSSGSGGFRDAIGPEKWYIGGRTPAGEERFYRLGMVTKGGGRLGGSGRVGSIDQLSL
ncbi:unnamed protein product [Penicillium salamii]|uniref:Uncharacterized protein n=1 Tax=Penicillium salamii TaxID=1612424 RepID=A0A9W4I4N5_9EURO|nr:unnamed protein product [Penicillium salamii]CAG8366586.1 unnamed protein product [Penicillium salamii]